LNSVTKSGAALKEVQKLSKHLVAYTEGLLSVSPYVKDPLASNLWSMLTNQRQPPPTRRRQMKPTLSGGG
jgi:hypothetical protein